MMSCSWSSKRASDALDPQEGPCRVEDDAVSLILEGMCTGSKELSWRVTEGKREGMNRSRIKNEVDNIEEGAKTTEDRGHCGVYN